MVISRVQHNVELLLCAASHQQLLLLDVYKSHICPYKQYPASASTSTYVQLSACTVLSYSTPFATCFRFIQHKWRICKRQKIIRPGFQKKVLLDRFFLTSQLYATDNSTSRMLKIILCSIDYYFTSTWSITERGSWLSGSDQL